MIKRYNTLSFLFFMPGLIAQAVGLMILTQNESLRTLAVVMVIGGTLLALTGFAYLAKAKGRNPLWALVGCIGLPGVLIMAMLADKSGDPWNT